MSAVNIQHDPKGEETWIGGSVKTLMVMERFNLGTMGMQGREEISTKRTSMTIDAGNWGVLGIKRVLASLVGQMVKNLPAVQETQFQSLGWEDPLQEGMVTHSHILA